MRNETELFLPESGIVREKPSSINCVPVPHHKPVAELLRIMKTDGAPDRWAAYYALACKEDAGIEEILLSETYSKEPRVRGLAAETLKFTHFGDRTKKRLLELLEDPEPAPVWRACETLVERGVDIHSQLLSLLQSANDRTREVALNCLAKVWKDSDFEKILEVHLHDRDSDIQKSAAFLLIDHVSSETWHTLFDIWIADPLPRHRTWACHLAEGFGSVEVLSRILPLKEDANGHVRKAAVRAINALERD